LPPPKRSEMGAFYVVFGPMELAAGWGYTTSNHLWEKFIRRRIPFYGKDGIASVGPG
jgi:hypothetical protein